MASTIQSRTNLGPLTTTFTPPLLCGVLIEACPGCQYGWQAQTCSSSSGIEDDPNCWPPRTTGVSTPNGALEGWGFYSPGLVCPIGMTRACSATGGGSTGWPIQFSLLEQETAVGCCPIGYLCTNNGHQTCISIATPTTTFSAVSCASGTSGLIIIAVPTTISTSSIISQFTINAPLIQINYQSSDLPSSTSSTSASSSTSKAISSSASTSSIATSARFSTGAKAGIGAGVALGALACLALAFFIYWKRHAYKRARQSSPTAAQQVYELNSGKGAYDTAELPVGREVPELPSGKERSQRGEEVHEMLG